MEVKEPALSYNRRTWTMEEYLFTEKFSNVKHEYYQGEVFAMSGPKVPHNIIAGNIHVGFANRLKGSKCKPLTAISEFFVEEISFFTYPDLSIVCGDIKTYNDDNWNIINPSLIIEVLTPSTQGYDRGEKFELYKRIPSLKEYLLVDSKMILAEAWHLNYNNEWMVTKYTTPDSVLHVQSLSISLPLTEIYDGTTMLESHT